VVVARRPPSRFRLLVVFLVLISLTLITLDASGNGNAVLRGTRSAFATVLDPVQQGLHDALRPVGNFLTGAIDYGALEAQNTRLRSELTRLRNQEAQAAFSQQQADQVLAEAHLPFLGAIKSVSAEVIDLGSSNFASTVTVDKGTSSGVKAGEPVVAAGGLAGTVTAATSSTATVLLLTDPTFVVGVSLPGGNVGSATGQGEGEGMKVVVLPSSAKAPVLKKGEILSTSGLSTEKFPPGIPVGRISGVTSTQGEADPTATLQPLVDVGTLGVVQILLWSPQ